ncbi:homoserine dehydrogenase [Calycomorphotria hydatis]|uniref:Homoserine dehydrogenase n=1 Tax=Calycomorphotria hydatis TaxID=2528027 RepID=A0A517TDU5_9PLAN|nr:homoserine dehydrogenase [Calycomorphotria hydatis]QDT66544.1 Homoserine dehydrogenase [Calycomorphotria hydatis]
MMKPLKIALIGMGTVGTGVARVLTDEHARITRRAGRGIEISHVVVRNPEKPREVEFPAGVVGTDLDAIMSNPEIDLVVELIGGIEPARTIVRDAILARKNVVTANKALLSNHGDELFALAREHGCTIGFEAAVAGGVPIIAGIGQSLAGNQVTSIEAILNGTSNFILTRMLEAGLPYDEAVKEAQELGYAEADPTMDVDGTDAAQKLVILTQLAFGTRVPLEQFSRQGIDTLQTEDLIYADELGYAVKLLGITRLRDGALEMHVQPTLVRHDRPLAQADGPQNMVAVEGDAVGMTLFAGPGAGMLPTASAVLADIIDVATNRAAVTFPHLDLFESHSPLPVLPSEETQCRYYFRFHVEDRPHVLADIADVLGRHDISLASVIQHESPEGPTDGDASIVPLVIMTHTAYNGQCQKAEEELKSLSAVRKSWVRMPVAD